MHPFTNAIEYYKLIRAAKGGKSRLDLMKLQSIFLEASKQLTSVDEKPSIMS